MDGAVTTDRINQWRVCGVKGFVLGTATLFKKEYSYSQILSVLKQSAVNSDDNLMRVKC